MQASEKGKLPQALGRTEERQNVGLDPGMERTECQFLTESK
jgi:hypothetical protein